MEGTASRVVLPGLFKFYTAIDHINDIGPVKDLVDKCLWKSGHVG
jgi:hypothetical protein